MIFQSSKFGHDISTWQDDPNVAGSVNFQKMRDNGASFVIMRASVGNQYDVDFPTYKINSRGILPRGVYHYYWNNIDPRFQAQTCLAAIGGEAIEGRVWLDLETREAGSFRGSAHWRTFIEVIQAAGYRVGIYTGYYWWKDEAVNKGADLNYFAQFPLWQAWYTANSADVLVALGWSSMMMWQDTSLYNGQNAGVESTAIDRDFWNDAYDFNTEWGIVTPPPNGGTMRYTATAINNDTRIRNFHNTLSTSTVLGSYPAGTVFEGDVIWTATAGNIVTGQVVGDKWLLTTKPLAGWVPVIHAGKPACNLTENVPPPAGAPASIDMQLAAGSVVTVKDAAGNVLWKGTA